MPAAAVIPAPVVYIKVVAVKKLVVEVWGGSRGCGAVKGPLPLGLFKWAVGSLILPPVYLE